MIWNQAKTNVAVLSLCQAMTNTTNAVILTVSGLTGLLLAPDNSFANLPLALQFLGTALTAAPASYFMQRFGRRAGFVLGAVIGTAGGVLGALAIYKHIFWLFGLGGFLLGVFNGFALYYRFAAADTAGEDFRSRAISLVLAGGVVAAVAGPELAKWSRNLLTEQFVGTYLSISLLPVICLFMLPLVRIPRVERIEYKDKGRPLTEVVRQPVVAVAIMGGMVSYGVMAFLMTATPLAMRIHSHPFNETAFVIQWHVLGMFAPSFFTGHLIKRYGVLRIMLAGILLNFLCILANLQGTAVVHFWLGLFLLGIGWNFLFVGATTLLTEGYRSVEKFKTQAINEFAVFSVMVVASMSSGTVLDLFGWRIINYVSLPFLLVMLAAIIALQKKTAQQE